MEGITGMNLGLIIIDDFYDDPDSIRELALSYEYAQDGFSEGYKFGNAPWAGKMSVNTHNPRWIDAKVSRILGKNLCQMRNMDSGKFRLSPEGTVSKNVCHVDSIQKNYYAGVLYLNKDIVQPGTIFYTHKDTGMDRAIDSTQVINLLKHKDDQNLNKWDINMVSYVTYNRLIVYPANKFHSPGPSFGTGNDSRLVQIFTWEEII